MSCLCINGPLKLVAASSPFTEQAFNDGLACLKQLAPEINTGFFFAPPEPDSTSPLKHLAGSDQQRAGFLNQALSQPGLTMMARGGFGVSRLLPGLDWAQIKKNKPLVMGFSDFSALLNPLAQTGLVALHGPSLIQLPRLDAPSQGEIALLLKGRLSGPRALSGQRLIGGNAKGRLMGGNLSMLCHLLGTPFAPEWQGVILAIEEVNEPPYALDRLLTQLELAGLPNKVAGIALGDLHGWQEQLSVEQQRARYEVVALRLQAWGKPLLVDLPFGHARRNRLLAVGAMASIEDNSLIMEI